MNTVSIIGTGYVGLVTGTCLAEFGMQVTCMDVDEQKIKNLEEGKIPIYEPGLEKLVESNYKTGRLKFTTSMKEAVNNSTAIFIAVGTPPREDGSADLHYVLSAAQSIAKHMNGYKVIIDKSTVPVGTGQRVRDVVNEVLYERRAKLSFDVVSNPEFLREGSAVSDFMHPDRVVIGTDSDKARDIMREIYNVLYLIDTPFVFTGIETAELIKYASNAFLATKITFINEMANLCEAVGADVSDVSKAMGLDVRIGRHFLQPGPGFGGSCFPKDTKALENIGHCAGMEMSLVKAVIAANDRQKNRMIRKIQKNIGDIRGKNIAVLGLAFKPDTDDMREAPSITIVRGLIELGAIVRAYDPASMTNAQRYIFDNIDNTKLLYCRDEYNAVENANALVLLTEWNQFKNLDFSRIMDLMADKYLFDFRNIYERRDMEKLGFIYDCIGRMRHEQNRIIEEISA